MNTNIFLHNLAILAKNPPQTLQVDADGMTLTPIKAKTATSALDVFKLVEETQRFASWLMRPVWHKGSERPEQGKESESAQEVFKVIEEMRQFATHLKRPVWIKVSEKREEGKETEFAGLTPEQIFNRILGPEKPLLSESELEKHQTISVKLQDSKDEKGDPIEFTCDRDLLSQHSSLIKDITEFGAPMQEGAIQLVGVKAKTFSKMLEFLNGAELNEYDLTRLQELFALGSQLGYNALMDEVALKLTRPIIHPEWLTSLPPELLHRMVSFLESYHAKEWLEAVTEGVTRIDRRLEKINADLLGTPEEKKVELSEEVHRLEDVKLILKRSVIDLINDKEVPFNHFVHGIESKDWIPKLLSIINLDPKRLHYADFRGASYRAMSEEEFLTIMHSCPNLQHLFVPRAKITDAAFAQLKGMPLSRMEFEACGELRNLADIEGMPLKSIAFHACGNLTDAAVACFRGMPLTSVEFSYCSKLTDAALACFQGMPLTNIGVVSGDKITNAGVAYLKGLPLKSVKFNRCGNLTNEALANLSGMSLTSVNFSRCFLLTNAALTYLEGMPLTEATFVGCDKITQEKIGDLPIEH